MTDSPKEPQVAILVDTSTGWGRRLIQGVINYSMKHGPWHLWLEPRGRSEAGRLPSGWDGDGIIARVSTQRIADELSKLGKPVINVSGIELKRVEFPRVTSNYSATAHMVAEHFLERGYRQFAYVGPLRHNYVRVHAAAFQHEVELAGSRWHIFNDREPSSTSVRWQEHLEQLGEWLQRLPKPVGVFTWATSSGTHVLEMARRLGIAVPDEMAVVGGDDDDVVCNATVPALSSVLTASEQIGHRAAAMMDQVFAGHPVDNHHHETIEPIQVTARGSSEALAIEDIELRNAVIYLRQNAYKPITVDKVADSVPMTRRSLERKFRKWFQRSPLQEIRRLRIARARELLVMTDLSVADIAEASGFGTLEYMSTTFKEATGITPLRFRTQSRGR